MNNVRVISRKRMTGNDKYSFCPYCVAWLTKEKGDYKGYLQTLFYQEKAERTKRIDENEKEVWEDYYFHDYYCEKCQRTITTDDFVNFYTVDYNGQRRNVKAVKK